MATLFFDTETTGLLNKKAPPIDPSQPNLAQLAAILFDENWHELVSLNCIVYPQDWEIPKAASDVHGITQETAMRYGINLKSAVATFLDMVEAADKIVAHNAQFDVTVMRRASHICDEGDDPFGTKPVWCTMLAATPVVKVLHAKPRHDRDYKYPKLEECYRHFFGEELLNAHDALVDVRACVRVYKALLEHYQIPE